ncbi:MAG: PDZ domain-containing protein [Gemmatimonadota bacterium]
MLSLKPILLLALSAIAVPSLSSAQISYDVSFPNVTHHEAVIAIRVNGLPPGKIGFRMSRSSPGRYAVHEFAKNIYSVSAVDGRGRHLAVRRPDPYQWDVTGHDGTVTLTYTLYADWGDGTYAQIDSTHAHLNMPATFMWAVGMDAKPIRVTFHPPASSGWKAATQLVPTGAAMTFTAPNLQYFMDSPTELSDYMLRAWTVTNGGRTDTIRLALHHTGTAAEADSFAEMAKKVVAQEVAVFGETAGYDHHTYTFIADYLPWASGDGMEHRNSTIISSSSSLARNASGLLGTLSHEFFHSWNMERIRSRAIEPFDFTRANMSGELWFGEGFTNYYGPMLIRRAGLMSVPDFAHQMGGAIGFVIGSPARKFFNPIEMSMQAPFVDAATAIDPSNRGNTFISYYTWGQVIGMGLDLTLRTRFSQTLDEFMRSMWAKHGKPEIPYTLDDIQRRLAQFTRDTAFARDFFAHYVRGRDVPDFGPLLEPAGMLIRPRAAGKGYLGAVQLSYDSTGATISGTPLIGTPIYQAGLDSRDRIVSVDSKPIRSNQDWQQVFDGHHPGDTVTVEFVQRGQHKTRAIALMEDPRLEVVLYEEADRQPSAAQLEFRKKWLGE